MAVNRTSYSRSKAGEGFRHPTGLHNSRQRNDSLLDQSIEDSFPASDASSSVQPGSLAAAKASDDHLEFANESKKVSARRS